MRDADGSCLPPPLHLCASLSAPLLPRSLHSHHLCLHCLCLSMFNTKVLSLSLSFSLYIFVYFLFTQIVRVPLFTAAFATDEACGAPPRGAPGSRGGPALTSEPQHPGPNFALKPPPLPESPERTSRDGDRRERLVATLTDTREPYGARPASAN